MGLPLANKPWQAGKSHVDGGLAGKIIHLYGGFSSVMFEYWKVQINPMAIYRHPEDGQFMMWKFPSKNHLGLMGD